jgi:hypothetical protein
MADSRLRSIAFPGLGVPFATFLAVDFTISGKKSPQMSTTLLQSDKEKTGARHFVPTLKDQYIVGQAGTFNKGQ